MGVEAMKDGKAVKLLISEKLRELLDEDVLDEDLPFIQLGLDSEGVVELVAYINDALGLECSASVIFDHPCINKLTDHLSTQVDDVERASGNSGVLAFEAGQSDRAVAIVGISGRYPGAPNLEQFWRNLEKGVDSVTEVPADRWDAAQLYDPDVNREDKIYAKWQGSLTHIDEFDPLFFNISPLEAESMDPQQRIFLQEAWTALEDAGLPRDQLSEQACGTYVGVMFNDYAQLLVGHPKFSSAQALTGNANSIFAARLAYFLNLKGPAIAVDTACSSSLVATHLACQALLAGEIDIGIAGGVTLLLSANNYLQMCRANMLSPEGKCKPFDNSADGFVPADGVGVVVLKRLADAERSGDRIYGVVRASALNQDGRTNGITAPSVQSQMDLQSRLYRRCSIDPATISYVEAHGTGTKLGDPIELEALSRTFAAFSNKKQYCGIGSVKGNIGHTSAAAGIAGLHKVLLMLKHKQFVPTAHFKEPTERFDFSASPFEVIRQTKPWAVTGGEKRRAAVSSFGFSGTNAHVVIDEYVAPQSHAVEEAQPAVLPPPLIVISAKNQDRLQAYVRDFLQFLRGRREHIDLTDLAYTLQVGRTAMEERLALVVGSREELETKLEQFLAGQRDVEGAYHGSVGGSASSLTAADLDTAQMVRAWIDKRDYGSLLDVWVKGLNFDWSELYGPQKPRRVDAPTYPFSRERYWVEAIGGQRPTSVDATTRVRLAVPRSSEPIPTSGTKPRIRLEPIGQALDSTGPRARQSLHGASVEVEECEPGILRIKMLGDPTASETLSSDLERCFRSIESRHDASVVLLVGGDAQFLASTPAERDAFLDRGMHLLPLNCKVPVIAVMKGRTRGLGWLVGALCDFMVCSEEGTYEYVVDGSGRVRSEEEYLLFLERFGSSFARELCYASKSYTGTELRERGLGMPVLPRRDVDSHALTLARSLCKVPQTSSMLLKRHLSEGVLRCASALRSSSTPLPEGGAASRSEEGAITFENFSQRAMERPGSFRTSGDPKRVELDSGVVRLEIHNDSIAVVTLCDKSSKNTFSAALVKGMQEAFDRIGGSTEYKAVVLTGYDQYFSAGGTKEDLLAIQEGKARFTDKGIYDLPLRCNIPVIAAMQGHGIGAGWSMGMCCDIVVFSAESIYLSPYMKYGFTPGAGATLIFPEKFGKDLGHEILFSAREYRADELLLRGMTSPVVPRAQVNDLAMKIAEQLASCSRDELLELKQRACRRLRDQVNEVYVRELKMHEECFVGNETVSKRITQYFDEGATPRETEGGVRDGVEPADLEAEAPYSAERADPKALAAIRDTLRSSLARELHIRTDQLSDRAKFLDLGLDSIIAVVWIRKLNSESGLSISATAAYQYPTIDEFSSYVLELGKGRNVFEKPAREASPSPTSRRLESPTTHEAASSAPEKRSVPTVDERRATAHTDPIAIVGMSGQFPQARNLEEFWENLVRGRNCITEVPSSRWDVERYYDSDPFAAGKTCSKWMGVLEDASEFDPLFFNISPTEARWIDPQQRRFLQNAWHCIEASGYPFSQLSASRCGIFVGCSAGDYGQSVKNEELNAQGFTGNSISILAARIAYLLNLQGPCLSVDTACSSSLVAIALACDSLVLNNCDLALAGGVAVIAGPTMHVMTSQAGMLSPDGRCYTFDQRANGFVPGEGVGAILLKRLRDAERDGDQIHGVIRGWGINQDGATNGITAPNPKSQARLQKEIYEKFSIRPEDIQLIEAHGTGTKLGDPIEVEGLKAAFEAHTARTNFCALGSVKSNVGHLLAAAGVAGTIKLLLALKHKTIPPTINYEILNEHIDLAGTPFYVANERRHWDVARGKKRLAAISSFGFSGTNAHIVIEEYTGGGAHHAPAHQTPDRADPQMVVLSARSRERLQEYAKRIATFVRQDSGQMALVDLAYTLQVSREPMEERLAFVAHSLEDLIEALEAFIAGATSGAGAQPLYLGHVDPRAPSAVAANEPQSKVRAWAETQEYHKVLSGWVDGLAIDWDMFHSQERPRRISVPTYPFAREHYWIAADQPPPRSLGADSSHESEAKRVRGPALKLVTNLMCGDRQLQFIERFVRKYEAKTARSKRDAIRHRGHLADPRTPIYFNPLLKELHYPITYERDRGAYIYDIDGNQYIDIACDYGVNLFGHRPPFVSEALKEQLDRGDALSGRYQLGEAAQLFCEITGHDRVLFCQSGTESLMSAVRLARAHTGKSKVVTFAGSYHGHYDAFLDTRTPGVIDSAVSDTLVLDYGDTESLNAIVECSSELAAVLVEPVQSSRIDLQPQEFLRALRQIATKENVPLIFDEMISGFRVHPQGCQGYWGIRADLATYGKILGGGLTAGAVGGRSDIMKWADGGAWQYGDQSKPTPITYVAGTHTQNPLKMAATLAILREIKKSSPNLQRDLNRKVERLCHEINEYAEARRIPLRVPHFGSQFRFKFLEDQFTVTHVLFLNLLNFHGVRYNLHGNCFLTTAHSERDVQRVVDAVKQSLDTLLDEGFFVPSTEVSVAKSTAVASWDSKVIVRKPHVRPSKETNGTTNGATKESAAGAATAGIEGRLKEDLKTFIADFLQVPSTKLSVDKSFSLLGIDSVMSMNLIKAIRTRYQIKLSPATIMEADTVEKLSRELWTRHHRAVVDHYGRHDVTEPGINNATHQGLELDEDSAVPASSHEGHRLVRNPPSGNCQDIAIIGIGLRFPDAENPEQFWRNLMDGKSSIREIPPERWDWRLYRAPSSNGASEAQVSKWGAFVDHADHFDPLFFNITPRDAETMDPQERIVLQESYHAVEDAGLSMADLSGSKTGVFIGYEYSAYREYCKQVDAYRDGADQASKGSSNPAYYLANRVSYTFNFTGPSEAVNVNCASSAVCVNRAYYALLNFECDLALAGGVCLNLIPEDYIAANKQLSPDGSCRVFDDRANGYVKGEGCGVVVLKRLEDAQRDGDRVYAVIKSSSQNNRGQAKSLAEVKPEALTDVIRTCHQRSKVASDTVDYIEVDGYCTKWGDAMEYEAIKRVLLADERSGARGGKSCGLGSLKGNIGHLEPVSGVASLIKVALSLHKKQFPATLGCEIVNEYVDVEEDSHPLYIVNESLPFSALPRGSAASVRAGINSFADSGVNVHILLEEYREPEIVSAPLQGGGRYAGAEACLVVLSARTEERLLAYAGSLLRFVEQDEELLATPSSSLRLRNLAYTLQVGRAPMEHRLAVPVRSVKELAGKLQEFIGGTRNIEGLYVGRAVRHAAVGAPAREEEKVVVDALDARELHSLARYWVQGGRLDWNRLYQRGLPRRGAGPIYPFVPKGYWAKPGRKSSNAGTPVEMSGAKKPLASTPAFSPVSTARVSVVSKHESQSEVIRARTEQLIALFAELYGVEAAELDEDRPFFELGMNSINVVEFVTQLERQLGISVEASDIFNYPTFRALAEHAQPDARPEMNRHHADDPPMDLSTILSQVHTDQLDVDTALELVTTRS
jgi:acyl transferase domain-containing protein/glutamate-1-semialdehyde aminotransferase/enoyl-CoA hydratase/carnithine racemase